MKNELLESLLKSDLIENLEFGSVLLKSENIPEEEREEYIKELVSKYLKGQLHGEVANNIIEAYNNLSVNKTIKKRVKKNMRERYKLEDTILKIDYDNIKA